MSGCSTALQEEEEVRKLYDKNRNVHRRLLKVPEYEVEADDGFGLRRLAAVEDGRLSLRPHEAAAVRQEAVVAGAHLTFGQHCKESHAL